ncbi:MAG: hypothetical protein JNK60_00800 [Acidobacteria bacterium]|nr:hypothetical protein [Acidobacteriota bacterium]
MGQIAATFIGRLLAGLSFTHSAMADANPKGSTSSGASAPSIPCPGCGWANAPAAKSCEFCRKPLGAPRPAPAPRAPAPAAPASAEIEEAEGILERYGIEITPRKILFGIIVGTALLGFFVMFRGNQKATTGDNMRRIVKLVEIYEGENGGYPPALSEVERRFGPITDPFRNDGWGNPIVYKALKPRTGPGAVSDGGQPLFDGCELRSGGPNGKAGDSDDVVWASP